jgi:Transposase and inactivated derivatives
MPMKAKRRRYDGAFKAKVGLEALKGIKTVSQIAKEFEVHPVQVSLWKSQVMERLPEVFDGGAGREVVDEAMVAKLHEKIGQLSVENDFLKKKCRQLDL